MPLTEISVRVTKKNIKDAIALIKLRPEIPTEGHCPVALALWDRGWRAYITRKCATVYRAQDYTLYNIFSLPEVAQEFVRNFDEGNPVQPIEFTLERNMDEEA